ncbi:hypothetical protein HDU76_008034 [Blyttiomyces sp. JEL0837]|nr:hypothetical protein HDU76_008034 [Blyttiomyces sp. JEL0837]
MNVHTDSQQPIEIPPTTFEYRLTPSPGRYLLTGLFTTKSPMFPENPPVCRYQNENQNETINNGNDDTNGSFGRNMKLVNLECGKLWNRHHWYVNIGYSHHLVITAIKTAQSGIQYVEYIVLSLGIIMTVPFAVITGQQYANVVASLKRMVTELNGAGEGRRLEDGHTAGVNGVSCEVQEQVGKGPFLVIKRSGPASLSKITA